MEKGQDASRGQANNLYPIELVGRFGQLIFRHQRVRTPAEVQTEAPESPAEDAAEPLRTSDEEIPDEASLGADAVGIAPQRVRRFVRASEKIEKIFETHGPHT